MRPIITPVEMRRVDDAATEPLDSIIDRVGALVAIAAVDLLGGTYGRRVVVLAGPGNNGADGRAAARHLSRRGVRCIEVPVTQQDLPSCDLVVDAAFGTGLSREYVAPAIPIGTPVLSVDIPSGFDGLTGVALGSPVRATRTLVLGALKPGLLFEPARSAAGEIRIVDIGLDATKLIEPSSFQIEPTDVAAWLPRLRADTHKWKAACWVVAGSPGMMGAATLAARGAQRGGASYVRLSSPGVSEVESVAPEIVVSTMSTSLETPDVDRISSLVVGPGLGREPDKTTGVLELLARVDTPIVLDADALWHLGADRQRGAAVMGQRSSPTVLTPHDGEFSQLFGSPPDSDRIAAAQTAANELGCVVLLKGATTVIAEPRRPAIVMSDGDARLATAGTGDVLAGLIGALLAHGVPAQEAAASGAYLHAKAALLGPETGLTATDVAELIPQARAALSGMR